MVWSAKTGEALLESDDQISGIIRARSAAAAALRIALDNCGGTFSEQKLADEWTSILVEDKDLLPFGWYQPPPHGVSVLIGQADKYDRLRYKSLRSKDNWPSSNSVSSNESVLYPYYSAVDRSTLMIGDHVGTYYNGTNQIIKEWMGLAYATTRSIVDGARVGMKYSELFNFGSEVLAKMGASNNNFSMAGGFASDIGHTVPFFGRVPPISLSAEKDHEIEISDLLATSRSFLGPYNDRKISENSAFTVEPQIIGEGVPMASFHMIVAFVGGQKVVVECFRDVFNQFGMTDWIYSRVVSHAGDGFRHIP